MKMSTKDFQSLTPEQISAMSREELLEAITKPMDAARKRLSNLKKAGFDKTPATMGFNMAGGTYKMGEVKKMTLNQMRSKARALQHFLRAKTSTPTGARDWIKHVQASMSDEQKAQWDNMDDTQKYAMWAMVDWVRGNYRGMYDYVGSDRVISMVQEVINRDGNERPLYDETKYKSFEDYELHEKMHKAAVQRDVYFDLQRAYDDKVMQEAEAVDDFDDLMNIVFTETEFKGAF